MLLQEGKIRHDVFLICCQKVVLSSDGNIDKREIIVFRENWEFHLYVRLLLERHKEIFLISHNASFDLAVIDVLKLIDDMNLKCKVYNPIKQAFYISFVDKSHILNCIDSLNFFAGKLEKLGDELEFPKMSMPSYEDSMEKWVEYCSRDVEIITRGLETISKIAADYGFGELTITRAKLAFSIFQNKFLHHRIELHNRIPQLELEFAGYYGGRTEAFWNGDLPNSDYYYVDFNSLYPSVMLENKVSVKTRFAFDTVEPKLLLERASSYNVIAKVTIQTPENCYPKRDRNSIIFPIGTFDTVLPHAELMDAIQLGRVKKVHYGYLFRRANIFGEFVQHFHQLKQQYKTEQKPIFTYFAKLMLNSLYGKFGQRIPELKYTGKTSKQRYGLIEHINLESGKMWNEKIINYDIYEESDRKVSTYSSPIIVSEITSAARLKLVKAMRTACYENIFYTDTDSLILNKQGYENLKPYIRKGKLGFLELEKTANKVSIHGLKDYKFGDTTKLKGIPRDAKEISPAVFQYEYWNTILDYLKGDTDNTAITETRKKVLRRQIRKGLLQKNKRIIPWNLDG